MQDKGFSEGLPRKKDSQSPPQGPAKRVPSVVPGIAGKSSDITPMTQSVTPMGTAKALPGIPHQSVPTIVIGKKTAPETIDSSVATATTTRPGGESPMPQVILNKTGLLTNSAAPGIPEVVWNGPMYGHSGYAKANREILLRAEKYVQIWIDQNDPIGEGHEVSQDMEARLSGHSAVKVSSSAPLLRFFGPRYETSPRYRIIYTMMETELVHPDMVRLINDNYHECWVPTRWNERTFRKSGVKIPIFVMPLGVDSFLYRPDGPAEMPAATLLTTREAGLIEAPKGFLFVYVFQSSFRKGIEILSEAFEQAFADDEEAGLILATTFGPIKHHTVKEPGPGYRSRIYWMSGSMSEEKMAAMYRACRAYACASLGEGWNLPMCEAAACGLPVVVPRTTVHPEIVDDTKAFLFDAEGSGSRKDAESISPWYKDIPFPIYGKRSVKQLASILKQIRTEPRVAVARGAKFSDDVRTRHTWDAAASMVVARIRQLCAALRS